MTELPLRPTFDPANLLWRTRGWAWDYEFVVVPSDPALDSWWSVFRAVFAGGDGTDALVQGLLPLPDGHQRPFVAASLADPEAVDESGRPVWHYLVWLPPAGVETPDALAERIPGDWPRQILRLLSPYYRNAFTGPVGEGSNQPPDLTGELREAFSPTPLEASAPNAHSVVEVILPKKAPPARMMPNPRRGMTWAALAAALVVLLILALYLKANAPGQ